MKRPILVSCYGFKVVNSNLMIHIDGGAFEEIPLNKHTQDILKDLTLKVCSFTLTKTSLSLCISKEVEEIVPTESVGVDRNLKNLTVGNRQKVAYYDMSRIVNNGETTKDIVKSFKRNDVRVRREIASKYGKRKAERVKRILHIISKDVVENALANKQGIVFEDIRDIRRMYQKGNGQGRDYRRLMNAHFPFYEIERHNHRGQGTMEWSPENPPDEI